MELLRNCKYTNFAERKVSNCTIAYFKTEIRVISTPEKLISVV